MKKQKGDIGLIIDTLKMKKQKGDIGLIIDTLKMKKQKGYFEGSILGYEVKTHTYLPLW